MSNLNQYHEYLREVQAQASLSDILAASKTGAVYRGGLKWHDRNGWVSHIQTGYYDNLRDARKNALRAAVRMGYTYPKWWQWWRWSEVRPNLDFS